MGLILNKERTFGLVEVGEYKFPGVTLKALKDMIPDWEHNAAEVGEDLGDVFGDLAPGPRIMSDLVSYIEELEAKLGSQNS